MGGIIRYYIGTRADSSVCVDGIFVKIAFGFVQKKFGLPCWVCKGVGFYRCKLCKGNSTIEWSPLYDPIFINPCLCPTCDGNRSVINAPSTFRVCLFF